MARDIEEFLRRAAERRKQLQQQQGQAPARPIEEVLSSREVEVVRPAREVVQPARPVPVAKPVAKQPAAKTKKPIPKKESVADHVQKHIDSKDIAQHATNLGERIATADDRMAARLKQKFTRDVSKLDDLPTVQDDQVAFVASHAVSTIARELISMIRSPDSVRKAVLMAEILKRPSFD
jgi:hypothetical protein